VLLHGTTVRVCGGEKNINQIKIKKMAKKKYEVTMVVECEEGAQNYIAQSVCDGLEEETCVKYINVKETK